MSIYMLMPGIPGSTTAQGYNQWIPLYSANCGVGRIINTVPGRTIDRIRSTAIGTEMEITKPLDQSSPLLFSQVCGGPALPEVKIDVCRTTSDGLISYWQYVLSNVLVSEYRLFCDEDGVIYELITLNYTNIEVSFIPYDSSNQPESPLRAAASVGCQPSLETHIRRQIQAKTPEGFNLFVATVYSEGAGVHNVAAWQAIGSVIMNRINTGVWWRRKTSNEVIKHTGFDGYYNVNKVDWDHLKFFDAAYLKAHPNLMRGPAGHQQFLKAWATLNKDQKINHQEAMTFKETTLLQEMSYSLRGIYNGHTITKANYYYSPRTMSHGKQPSFLSGLKDPEQYKVVVPGVREHDFKFYYIPTAVERAAGEKAEEEKKKK